LQAERKVLDDALDRNLQYDWMDEETLFWLDRNYTNSNLQYDLLMENLQALETSLAGKDLKMLEKDILVHIEQLGALGSFNASMSRATLDTLTQTSHEPDFSLLDKVIKFDPETPLKEQDAEVIVRSGKSQERKQKRRSKKSRKYSSSQFISEWKNYPGRRRTIVREQSSSLVTIKVLYHLKQHS
jgi:RNA polymerase primary sigma factor/RNA polymerase sigma factor